ncbi:MAG: potassium transporter TrkG, partial [Sutterellaceae bacterium]|nr:TrkH family potassium uptake protein [Burkholderiaceae bacterium]MDW8430548.1 potassium transporter TrkG [Sutterellaceae bacterium]
AMLVPLAVAFFGADAALRAYDEAFLITLAVGAGLWFATRRYQRELAPRDGFLLVTLVWTTLPAVATLPLLLHLPDLSFTDAYFETMSGLTTTGATVLTGLDELPLSINVWRHLLVWIGGMGVIVLAVAILPLLGVGGSQIYKAEVAGPLKESKLTPRIAETAKGLYLIYLAISAACVIAYRIAGMSWPDAFMHMCSTMGLGGFSSHDASFGYWDSPTIEYTAVFFMLLAGFNFSMHFLAWRRRTLVIYWRDTEGKTYLTVTMLAALAVAVYLTGRGVYADFPTALRYALFNVVSIATTTGYTSTDYAQWPIVAPVLMLFLCGFATCAGSTGGGIKMVRAIILLKQAMREFVRVLHPRVVNPVRIGEQVIENRVIFAVLAFMLIYGATIIWGTFLLLLDDVDVVTAFTAIVACVNNTGPGLGEVGPAGTYQGLSDFATWVCSIAMLLGRLEMMSVLVLFTPAFWRK